MDSKRDRHTYAGTSRGTKIPTESYLTYWYQALTHELGLYLEVTQRRKFVNELYQARLGAADERLEALMILQPGDAIVFIAKKEVEIGPELA